MQSSVETGADRKFKRLWPDAQFRRKVEIVMNLKSKLFALAGSVGLFAQSAVFALAAEETTGGATATTAPEGTPSGGIGQWIPIIIYLLVIVAMFYFLIIRPNKKRKKAHIQPKNYSFLVKM